MKLLLTGNIGYITAEFIEEAFPECQILLLGDTKLKSNRRKGLSVHPMPKQESEFRDIFKTYDFEGVIYFSNYLSFHGTKEGVQGGNCDSRHRHRQCHLEEGTDRTCTSIPRSFLLLPVYVAERTRGQPYHKHHGVDHVNDNYSGICSHQSVFVK